MDTQLRDGTPPETGATRDRLVAAGYPEPQARRLIGVVAAGEIFEAPRRGEPYDEARYVAALRRLPAKPLDFRTGSTGLRAPR